MGLLKRWLTKSKCHNARDKIKTLCFHVVLSEVLDWVKWYGKFAIMANHGRELL